MGNRSRPSHPQRDFILLPLIVLATWITLLSTVEISSRLLSPQHLADACVVRDNAGDHFRPVCSSTVRTFEGQWVKNDYNDCGFRSAHPCSSPTGNGLRVAILGTSPAHGYWVSYDQSFTGRIEHDLSAACGKPVDVQNAALPTASLELPGKSIPLWHYTTERAKAVLQTHPEALVVVMNAADLGYYKSMPSDTPTPPPSRVGGPKAIPSQIEGVPERLTFFIKTVLGTSRAYLFAKYLAYGSDDYFVHDYLRHGDVADYLKQPFTPLWQMRLRIADQTIGEIAHQAQAVHVPLLVAYMLSRAQAILSVAGALKDGTNPFAFDKALLDIAHAHGADLLDLTDAVSKLNDPADLYFTVDGHPNAPGHAILAAAIEKALVSGVPDQRRARFFALQAPEEIEPVNARCITHVLSAPSMSPWDMISA